jgi:16S rRNA (uracil1498-N3)-methyltransferase
MVTAEAKSLTRLYFPDEIPDHSECVLPAAQAHHVARVLRLAAGDALTLFDGAGTEYPAVISHLDKSAVKLRVGESRECDRESPLWITVAQAISSGERMDFTVQKAVELGAARIVPLISSRCVVRLSGERAVKRVAHWQAVAVSACEQCGRNRVPQIAAVASLADWLGRQPGPGGATRLLLAPRGDVRLREIARPAGEVTLLIGPEGGFAPEEADAAGRAGFTAVRLGPRVLRTETGAVAALAALQTLWGDL